MIIQTSNTGPVLSANTLSVLTCLTYGLDLATANYIASLGASTNNTKGKINVPITA